MVRIACWVLVGLIGIGCTTSEGGDSGSTGGEGGSASVGPDAGGSGGEAFVEERRNEGAFCIGNNVIRDSCMPTDIPEGEPFELYVDVGCACDAGERDAGCEVRVTDSSLVIESWYVFAPNSCPGLLCAPRIVSCQAPALDPGTYLVRHGALSVPIDVPSESVFPCAYPDEQEEPSCCIEAADCEASTTCSNSKCVDPNP